MVKVESLDMPLVRPIFSRYFSFGTLTNMKALCLCPLCYIFVLFFLPLYSLEKVPPTLLTCVHSAAR